MGFKLKIKTKFVNPLPDRVKKRILRQAAAKVATRIRKRLKAKGELKDTGQMNKSFKAKISRKTGAAIIAPRGIRDGSEARPGKRKGSKPRKPMPNFAIAAFQSAKGRDPLGWLPEDEQFFMDEVERLWGLHLKKAAGLTDPDDD